MFCELLQKNNRSWPPFGRQYFCHYELLPFVNNVTNYWSVIEQMPNIDTPDKTTVYLLNLQTLVAKTNKILQKLCIAL